MSNIKQNDSKPPANIEGLDSDSTKAKSVEELTPVSTRTLTQSEIDAQASLVKLELETLRLEREKLELEKLKKDIQDIRREQEAQRVARDAVQESLDYETNTRIHNETFCTHMKGGASENMMHGAPAQGNDASNYAMWQHTLTTGVTFRLCSRCGKTWFPKDPDYRWAMTRPTRNSPSTGSPSPGLVRHPKNVRIVSEVPHRQPPQNEYEFSGLPQFGQ